jgi:cystathionine beta-lyase
LRLERHQASALEIAHWLDEHPAVETVIHPALESHPEHDLWRRDLTGSSGVFGFVLEKELSRAQLSTFLDPMDVFAIGLSWGGFQSLVKAERISDRVHPFRYEGRTIIRLSIGLEDVDAMKLDLSDALDRVA